MLKTILGINRCETENKENQHKKFSHHIKNILCGIYSQEQYYYDIIRYAGKRFFQDKNIQADQQVLYFHGCIYRSRILFLCPGFVSGISARHHDAASALHCLVIVGTYRLFGNCHCPSFDLYKQSAYFCCKKACSSDFFYSYGLCLSLCLNVHHRLCLTIAFEQSARAR